MVQFTVSRGVIHDIAWMTLAVVVLCHLLHQPPAPPDRTAHQQPAPRHVPQRDGEPEGVDSKVTPLPRSGTERVLA